MSKRPKFQNTSAILAVVLITLGACFWAFWGALEAFHEGWCRPTLPGRLIQTIGYLIPAIGLSMLGAICIYLPRIGAIVCVSVSIALSYWVIAKQANFGPFILATLIGVPAIIGVVFWFSEIKRKRLALIFVVGLPFLIAFICGLEPAVRVANRLDDGGRGERRVVGNGVELIWAPAGPGWTRYGNVSWEQAKRRASCLTDDGLRIESEPQNIWRLPSRAEIVSSLTRRNENSGGQWHENSQTACYVTTPDKETPIWDPLAPMIYLWTSESDNEERAWIVVYHGGVHSKPKNLGASSLGFRAVRDP